MFFLLIQVLAILRVVIKTNELSHNLVTFFASTLKQMFSLILSLSLLVILSLLYQFLRFPFELAWFNKITYLLTIELSIIIDFITALF